MAPDHQLLEKNRNALKDIRAYIGMAMQGNSTIMARAKLVFKQREVVRAQMAELQKTMDTLDYKCW